jgi:tRNA modification GTPase
MRSVDTIYALSSGRGRAGVAVIRVRGPQAGDTVRKLSGGLPVPRQAMLRKLVRASDGSLIDKGLVLWFPGPSSFTGEDVAEFHIHGGLAVTEAFLAELSKQPGLRIAEAGEFTRRAFGHGKYDLTEVEGLADLIEARSERQRRLAVRQAEGAASTVLNGWRQLLIGILARLEAAIDFVDEADVSEKALEGVSRSIRSMAKEISKELERGRQGERLRDGIKVVLAGMPNVGKSSLLNRLAGKEAAIVSPMAGTTRDIVEAHLSLAGLPVILRDTAGLRAIGSDVIEREGVARAQGAMGSADLVLWVASPDVAGSAVIPDLDSEVLQVWNKADLAPGPASGQEDIIAVSSRTGEGLALLERELVNRLQHLVADGESAIVTRQRHREALTAMLNHLEMALETGRPLEIVAEEIRLATYEIGKLTGYVEVETLLDDIFREFCVGK